MGGSKESFNFQNLENAQSTSFLEHKISIKVNTRKEGEKKSKLKNKKLVTLLFTLIHYDLIQHVGPNTNYFEIRRCSVEHLLL